MKVAQSIDTLNVDMGQMSVAQAVYALNVEAIGLGAARFNAVNPKDDETGVDASSGVLFDWSDSEGGGVYRIVASYNNDLSSPLLDKVVEGTEYQYNSALTQKTYWKIFEQTVTDRPAIVPGTTVDDSLQGDRDSLQLHYDSLNGDNWTNSWDESVIQSGDLSTLNGIETDANGRVISLDLQGNNCIGELPEFPGLQKCTIYNVKQVESETRTPPARITGAIPKSLGHTSIETLILAGRTTFNPVRSGIPNKKAGIAWNQYTGEFPEELYNLTLKVLEFDGVGEQFNGVWDTRIGNWDIEYLYCNGNIFYNKYEDVEYQGASFSGFLPSEIKNWTNCKFFMVEDQDWTGIAVDAFEGWNPVSGRIMYFGIDQSPYDNPDQLWDQDIPEINHLRQVYVCGFNNRAVGGQYPREFIKNNPTCVEFGPGIHRMTANLQGYEFDNAGFQRFGFMDWNNESNVTGGFFAEGEYVGGYFGNQMILMYCRDNPGHTAPIPDGMHEWWKLRTLYMHDMALTGALPSRPPGMYGPTMQQLRLDNNELTGTMSGDWAEIGSQVDYGEVISPVSTITAISDPNAETFWIEDSNASFETDEFASETETSGPVLLVDTPERTWGRRVISNTATRIYYEGDNDIVDIAVGQTYRVGRNIGTDKRPLKQINLSNNRLSGTLLSSAIPKNQTEGSYDISDNYYTISDFVSSIQDWLDAASANGWTFTYSPQQRFGESVVGVNKPVLDDIQVDIGGSFSIDVSGYDASGNVYTWYKDGIEFAHTGPIYSVSTVAEADYGTYKVEITNSSVPNHTDVSRDIIVEPTV